MERAGADPGEDPGTLEVLEGWVEPEPGPSRPATPGGALVVALVLVSGVILSFWSGEAPRRTDPARPAERGATVTFPAPPPPTFAHEVGAPLAVLSMSGVVVLDLDAGSVTELDLGAVRAFGSAPALVALGPQRLAVLFSDHSVGVVELEERSVTRIAEDVQAIMPAGAGGGMWARRLRDDGGWDLTQIDADGRALSVALEFRGTVPPSVHSGRPRAGSAGEPSVLAVDGPFLVEVHERRDVIETFDVRIIDVATGGQRWLRDLSHPPVLTPDGRRILVGETAGHRLASYDLATLEVETVEVPRAGGVGLDWANLVVLPPARPDGGAGGP